MFVYQYTTDFNLQTKYTFGAYPDGIVGESGLLQTKIMMEEKYREKVFLPNECPDQFWDQIQGQLQIAIKNGASRC
jgi:hypothetical protein